MKTEAKITNRIITLKESLGLKKLTMLYLCLAISGLIITLFAYWPLMGKLHNSANRLDKIQDELLNRRNAIAAMETSTLKTDIISQKNLSQAIADLTEKGRTLGLQFNSIAQQPLQNTTQPSIAKLPISFTIESKYKSLCLFLAYVEEYSGGIIEVKNLSIHQGKVNLSKLTIELTLNLYVEI